MSEGYKQFGNHDVRAAQPGMKRTGGSVPPHKDSAVQNYSQVPEFLPPNARPPLMLSLCGNYDLILFEMSS